MSAIYVSTIWQWKSYIIDLMCRTEEQRTYFEEYASFYFFTYLVWALQPTEGETFWTYDLWVNRNVIFDWFESWMHADIIDDAIENLLNLYSNDNNIRRKLEYLQAHAITVMNEKFLYKSYLVRDKYMEKHFPCSQYDDIVWQVLINSGRW